MTTLVVGASGATGRLLVEHLLNQGQAVKIIVRGMETLPGVITGHDQVTIIKENVLDLSDEQLREHVKGCEAIASCLGHNMSFKGMYGQPRWLVTDATRRLCGAIKANGPEKIVKFVLMNTSGNSNRDISEPVSIAQQIVIVLLRLLLPPHLDNEKAADYLRVEIGQRDSDIEWVAVRPDGLTNESEISEYDVHSSPTRSAIFDAGTTSRINVGHFMSTLIADAETWGEWKGKMPVIYNKVQAEFKSENMTGA